MPRQYRLPSLDDLSLLWSEVEWPFDPERMQKSAVEFHEVVHQVFKQTAVIPFRLLSVFDDQQAFTAFAAENRQRFLQDLNRLKDFVQMECVIYPKPSETRSIAAPAKPIWSRKLWPCDLQKDSRRPRRMLWPT